MTASILPRTAEPTPESLRLARIIADLAAIESRQADPQGWGKLLEDERSRLLSEKADLERQGVALVVETVWAA